MNENKIVKKINMKQVKTLADGMQDEIDVIVHRH